MFEVDFGSCQSDFPASFEYNSDLDATLEIGTLEYYIDDLNTNGPLFSESKLDAALMAAHHGDPEQAKELRTTSLNETLLAKGHLAPDSPPKEASKEKRSTCHKVKWLHLITTVLSRKERSDATTMQRCRSCMARKGMLLISGFFKTIQFRRISEKKMCSGTGGTF